MKIHVRASDQEINFKLKDKNLGSADLDSLVNSTIMKDEAQKQRKL